MYLINAKKCQDMSVPALTQRQIIFSSFILIYGFFFLLVDITYLKIQTLKNQQFSFTELYICMAYLLIIQGYTWYNWYKNRKQTEKEISYVYTIVWHSTYIFKTTLIGLAISSETLSIHPFYFILRLTVYGYGITVIINDLRLINNPIVYINEMKRLLYQESHWQLNNFYLIYYASVVGITIDVLSFGNDMCYKIWLGYISSFILYEFVNIMNKFNGWNFFTIIFSSE